MECRSFRAERQFVHRTWKFQGFKTLEACCDQLLPLIILFYCDN